MLSMDKSTISTGPFSSSQTVNVITRGYPIIFLIYHTFSMVYGIAFPLSSKCWGEVLGLGFNWDPKG